MSVAYSQKKETDAFTNHSLMVAVIVLLIAMLVQLTLLVETGPRLALFLGASRDNTSLPQGMTTQDTTDSQELLKSAVFEQPTLKLDLSNLPDGLSQ